MTRALIILAFVAVVTLFAATNPGSAFEENIVAAWLMEEGSGDKIQDSTGHFPDGDIMGNPEWVDGKFGTAMKFDGSTVYARIPYNTDFQVLNQGDFTTAAWFNTEILPSDDGNWHSILVCLGWSCRYCSFAWAYGRLSNGLCSRRLCCWLVG